MNLIEWFDKFCAYLDTNGPFPVDKYSVEYIKDTTETSHKLLMIKKDGEHTASISVMTISPEVHVFSIRDRRPTGSLGTVWKFPSNDKIPKVDIALLGIFVDTFGDLGSIIADVIKASMPLVEDEDEA